jgi:hypothetical protein
MFRIWATTARPGLFESLNESTDWHSRSREVYEAAGRGAAAHWCAVELAALLRIAVKLR